MLQHLLLGVLDRDRAQHLLRLLRRAESTRRRRRAPRGEMRFDLRLHLVEHFRRERRRLEASGRGRAPPQKRSANCSFASARSSGVTVERRASPPRPSNSRSKASRMRVASRHAFEPKHTHAHLSPAPVRLTGVRRAAASGRRDATRDVRASSSESALLLAPRRWRGRCRRRPARAESAAAAGRGRRDALRGRRAVGSRQPPSGWSASSTASSSAQAPHGAERRR